MTPLLSWRQTLRALIPRGFLRRDWAADGLLISDYPRHCPDAAAVDAALRAAGFTVTAAEGLRRIDGSPAQYRQLLSALSGETPPPWTEENLYLCGLARRLMRGERNPARQPLAPVRLTLKCLDAGDTETLIRLLPPMLAACQRRGQPLPAGAGALIARYLKGENPC